MHDKLLAIANTYQAAKENIQTEEATKNALIMPFIAAMGYNVFNPMGGYSRNGGRHRY
jgi:hypothetical protein